MAATVLTPAQITQVSLHEKLVQVFIPTTVDGAAGATCNFELPRAWSIGLQSQKRATGNYNGKTITIKASIDGINYAALPTNKAFTDDGMLSVATADTGFLFYQVSISGAPTTAGIDVWINASQL